MENAVVLCHHVYCQAPNFDEETSHTLKSAEFSGS